MALPFDSSSYTNNHGQLLVNQPVQVRMRLQDMRPVTVYSDPFGTLPIANPTTDGSGVFAFYGWPGTYSIGIGPYRFTKVLTGSATGDTDLTRVRKATTEPLESTTIADDPELFLPVAANATYQFEAYIHAYAEPATDFRISFTGPAGATLLWSSLSPGITAAAGLAAIDALPRAGGDQVQVGASGVGTIITPKGFIYTAGTAGNLRFRRAIWNAAAEDPEIYAGSWLEMRRLA